mmetsp:Transcript_36528/g.82729  ORF Transcript_36528/g.82729 Transcript_36528/m.82729 type:complete len:249 (-) Transcript_36528:49-795(-)
MRRRGVSQSSPDPIEEDMRYVRLSMKECVASISRAMCASLKRTIWWSSSFFPNVLRCRAHATDSERHTRANLFAWMASPSRSVTKLRSRTLASPMRLVLGTRTSSNSTYAVPEPWTPMHSRGLTLTPGRDLSISRSDTPAIPESSPPVRTAVVKKSANMPHVIHFLRPDTTKKSPSSTAVVLRLATSDPPLGSLTASAIRFSPSRQGRATRCLSSGVPKKTMGGRPMPKPPVSPHTTPPEAQRLSSSK